MIPVSRRDASKRLFDLVVAGALLVLLSPMLVGLALMLRLSQGPPVLYRQRRPGLHGQPFTIHKYRTMACELVDAHGNKVPAEQRTTPLGRRLRSLSLDELPELLIVIRGDTSLVGRRPLLMQYLPRYSPEQARRDEVRPSITGLAQLSGRNALEREKRSALDVKHIDEHDLRMDLVILAKTVNAAHTRKGISYSDQVDMPLFLGSEASGAGENDGR